MSKILVLGMSPLPFENDRKVYGTGIRSWQFMRPLLDDGHEICACNFAIPSAYPENLKPKFLSGFKHGSYSFSYNILPQKDFEDMGTVKRIYDQFKPDCIVGCTFYPSYIAARLLKSLENKPPFWADLFGHVMAEAQARAAVDGDDGCLFHYWNSEYNIITSADMFSCVSGRQEYALVGELGAVGRLNRFTSGYNFSCNIPCGMPDEEYSHARNVIRGKNGISEGDFVVLWTGGYNTWTDTSTLFCGLEMAMKEDDSIKFVSTGGEIPEQDIKTYPRFLEKIRGSKFRDNFLMEGWIDGKDVPNYYLEADIGINIDQDIYEVRLGSKNRILDWFRAGLCVLSSNVCELTEIIKENRIGYTFKPHDSQHLKEKLLYLASNREKVKQAGKKGQEFARANFNFTVTTRRLRKWADNPVHAPDWGKKRQIFYEKEEALNKLEQITNSQKQMIKDRDERISRLEAIIKGGFAYRVYSYFKMLKSKLGR
ncbi:MAG: glycosyltransferase [Actinomycetota bacterium]